jgi:hypothetical protein
MSSERRFDYENRLFLFMGEYDFLINLLPNLHIPVQPLGGGMNAESSEPKQ